MNKHFKEGQIQAYLDGVLEAGEQTRLQDHLQGCPDCRGALEAARQRSQLVQERLARLETPGAAPSLEQARREFTHYRQRKEEPMLKKIFKPSHRPALVTALVILLLAASLAIPSVRAAAVDFLGLFRVQQVQFIQIDPSTSLNDLDSAFQTLGGFLENQVQFKEKGSPVENASLEEVRQLAGFPVRMPGEPEVSAWEYSFHPGVEASFTADLALLQPILNELGDDLTLPQSLNGAEVSVDVDGGVTAMTGDCRSYANQVDERPRNCYTFIQVRSPAVSGPADADLQELGRIYLRILGFSPREAQQISQRVDWATTLVVPIPANKASYRAVEVDGVEGALISSRTYGNDNPNFSLIWVKDGILYAISGRGSTSQALEMANSLK